MLYMCLWSSRRKGKGSEQACDGPSAVSSRQISFIFFFAFYFFLSASTCSPGEKKKKNLHQQPHFVFSLYIYKNLTCNQIMINERALYQFLVWVRVFDFKRPALNAIDFQSSASWASRAFSIAPFPDRWRYWSSAVNVDLFISVGIKALCTWWRGCQVGPDSLIGSRACAIWLLHLRKQETSAPALKFWQTRDSERALIFLFLCQNEAPASQNASRCLLLLLNDTNHSPRYVWQHFI